VGCEPAQLSEQIGLSAPVAHGVEKAIQMVKELVDEQLQQGAALQDI
jgi:ribosomal protein S16